jgi:NPCBM/NEW2 domain/Hypothetical glycosyl hydrolase family 15
VRFPGATHLANPAFRAWWIANAQTVLAHGYGGLWVDDVNLDFDVSDGNANLVAPIDFNTRQTMTQDAWRTYMASYLEQIRYSFPATPIEHNSVWFSDTQGVRDANPYIDRQIAAADVVHLERGIGSDAGLRGGTYLWSVHEFLDYIDRVHAKGDAVTLQQFLIDRPTQEYSLAGYFLISAGRDTTGDSNTNPDNWWTGYDVNMGAPSGPRTWDNELFRRNFAKGMVLLNDPGGVSTTVYLDGTYSRLDGSSVVSVTLGALQGAVLLKTGPTPGAVWVSDLTWSSATNGFGPVQIDKSTNGNMLSLNGNRYLKGLGVHSDSAIAYSLGGACTSFTATVGLDDEVPAGYDPAVFQVWADGMKLFDSGPMSVGSSAQNVAVNVTGAAMLTLVVTDAGLGTNYTNSDWAGALLTCSSVPPKAGSGSVPRRR